MGKKIKQITIDEDLIDFLKDEANCSGLINRLLKDYFGSGQDMERQQLEKKIVELKKEIDEKKKQLEGFELSLGSIEKKKKEAEEIFKDVPREILSDFMKFDITPEALFVRYNNIYKWNYPSLEFEDLRNTWLAWKKHIGKTI
jgi:hypothetical protein